MKKHLPIIFIVLLSIIVRFYKIGTIPYGYNWDETSIIYNAWGIADWYRDEWGKLLPLAFRSFGDYKAPMLFYLLALPYKLFGVTESLIRIYSAIFGTLAVFGIYLVSKELFPKQKHLPIISALLLAVSPWAINFSRVGFEANIGVSIVTWAIYFLLKGQKNKKFWNLSAFLFAISFYAYHSTKIFVPLFLLVWVIQNRESLFKNIKNIKNIIQPLIVFTITSIPVIYVTFFGKAFERGMSMIFFNSSGKLENIQIIFKEFISNTLNQLSPSFWIRGIDYVGLRHLTPGFGIIYKIELPIFLISLFLLIKRNIKQKNILLTWLIIGMMPAILSHNTPHAVRSLLILPVIQIVTSYGFIEINRAIKSMKLQKYFIVIVTGLLIYSFGSYLKTYYSSYAIESAKDFQYGYKEAVIEAKKLGKSKQVIEVTDAYHQPYVYVLLHNRIKPQEYLSGALANYEFHSINWPYYKPSSMVVATSEEIPIDDPAIKSVIKIPNTDEIVFVVAEARVP